MRAKPHAKAATGAKERSCRRCGCTETTPCVGKTGETCMWAARDLCTACLTTSELYLMDLELSLRLLAEDLEKKGKILWRHRAILRAMTRRALDGSRQDTKTRRGEK